MNTLDTIKQAAKAITHKQHSEGYQSAGLHQYTDTNGNIQFVRLRMEKPDGEKWIRPLSRDEVGNWTQLKEPTFENGKPLYQLHRLANNPDQVVFIVEGEKCADALIKLGLLATTSGGASSMNDADWQILSGRKVIIWADNDPAGLQYANDVATELTRINANIKHIDIDALNLPPKGDCVDWLQQFKQTHGRNAVPADIEALALKLDAIQSPTSDYLQSGEVTMLTGDKIQHSSSEIKLSNRKDDEVIAELATLSPIEYDRVRASTAKALNVRPGTLDMIVKQARASNQENESPFQDVEPWHEAINPAELLDDITRTIQRFIVLDKHQAQAAALWVSACWFVDVIQCAPIALINAPERACGKTQLLTVLAKLAPRTAQASGISPSVLFRMIETYRPTLFIDEVETILKDNEDLRGLINAGHTRDSAKVWRSVAKGDDFEPKCFSVWGMKAVAGINAIKLAETVTSRSIVFELRRKRTEENVTRLRHAEAGLFDDLAAKLARFADDYAIEVQQARPHLPDKLGDRDQDNWEPLLQLASVAGGHWPDTAIKAALKLSGASSSTQSTGNELLADIQTIFEANKTLKISTAELIKALCEDEEASWATYNRGKPLTPRQLATRLSTYGISSKTIRMNSYETAKGFEVEQFSDAFTRYLSDPLNLPSQSNNSLEANNGGGSNVTDSKNVTVTEKQLVTLEAAPNKDCYVVTDKPPILESIERARPNDDVMVF